MAWLLLLLGAAAIVAVLVWDFRRKAAQREAASKERFEQIFQSKGAGAGHAPSPGTAADSAGVAPPATDRPAAPAPFLAPAEKLAYLLLKSGIPDHEVFPRVSLAAVAGAAGSGAERDQQLRRLSQYVLHFVVCDREMRVVAAVELRTVMGAGAEAESQIKADCLKSVGIPLIRLDAASLPRRDEIRALVCGAGEPAAGTSRK